MSDDDSAHDANGRGGGEGPLTAMNKTPEDIDREKQAAAEAAAELAEDGMTVGLGTGSTVAFLLPALARRSLDIVCAATSPRTEHAARQLGLRIEDTASISRFDIAIIGSGAGGATT